MGSHLDRSQKNSDLSHQIFLAHITLPASLLSGLIALGAGFKEDDEDDGDKRLRLSRVSFSGSSDFPTPSSLPPDQLSTSFKISSEI